MIFPKIWNMFQNDYIKIIRKRLDLKLTLKTYLLGELMDVVTCDWLLFQECHPITICVMEIEPSWVFRIKFL
jgi:hypothetical protein